MTISELKQLAKEVKIPGYSRMNKEQLETALVYDLAMAETAQVQADLKAAMNSLLQHTQWSNR
jgi:hypothetical protein